MVPAISAKTPSGATFRIIPTMAMMAALRLSNRSSSGCARGRGIRISATPRRNATKTTLSMARLFAAAARTFSGAMSTSGCSGPDSMACSMASCRPARSPRYVSWRLARRLSGMDPPGWIRLTRTRPMTRATRVVAR